MKQLKTFLLTLILFLPFFITGCSNDKFNFKNSTLIDDSYTIIVENNVEEYSLIDDISVGKKQTWTVAKDEYGVTTFTTKKVPLVIGDNYYYIIVFDKNDESELYKINIRRKPNLKLKFNYENIDDLIISDFEDIIFPVPATKSNYSFNGWNIAFTDANGNYKDELIDNETIKQYLHLDSIILTPRFTPLINLNTSLKEYEYNLNDILNLCLLYDNYTIYPGTRISGIDIYFTGNVESHTFSIKTKCKVYKIGSNDDGIIDPLIDESANIILNNQTYYNGIVEGISCNSKISIGLEFIRNEITNKYANANFKWSIIISVKEV